MLFLHPRFIGKEYGTYILRYLIETQGIQFVDVNSQNTIAKRFYEKHGFSFVSEDLVDGYNKPYPITHLKLTKRRGEGA